MTSCDRHHASDAEREISTTITQYGNLVAAAARRIVGPRGDIEDVVQETWCTFVRHGHAVRDPHCLGGWLFRVATNAAIRAQVGGHRASLMADPTLAVSDDGGGEAEIAHLLHRAEQRAVVSTAVRTLSSREQIVLELLCDDSDLGYREISNRSGIPMGSVGPTRDRAIRKLRALPEVRRLTDAAA